MVAGVSDTLSSVAGAYNDATQHKSHTASVCTDGSSHTIEAHLVVEVEARPSSSCINIINHLRNYADVDVGLRWWGGR